MADHHRDVIEAGAVALHDLDCHCGDELTTMGLYLKQAQTAYVAMEPHIRKTVAEEIATAIEAIRDVNVPDMDWDCTPAIEQTLTHASVIAREHGEAVS